MKLKRRYFQHVIALTLAALLLVACSDEITSESNEGVELGLQFDVITTEIGEQTIDMGGSTRSSGSAMQEEDLFKQHTLEGDNRYGLKVQRIPLPLVEINRTAVRSNPLTERGTRAEGNEVVEDITNFHDSLTIWGYTDNGTTLLNQIILMKIRNWRTSLEWPYDQGTFMRFYAVTPALESTNMLVTGTASYSTPPQLIYTLPEKVEQMRDILYGESENTSIAGGPEGSMTNTPKEENLGKDNKRIGLSFNHILSAVRFSQGIIPSGLTITSIQLKDVKNKGTYNPASADAATGTTGTWTPDASTATYTLNTSFAGTGTANTYIDDGKILFMIPHTLADTEKLIITLTDAASNTHTVSCSLGGDVWKKGYTVNYKITIGELKEGYTLTAESAEGLEHSNTTINSSLGVHSYQLFSDYSSGAQVLSYHPVTWEVAGYSEDTEHDNVAEKEYKVTRPTWLTDFHGTLTGDKFIGGETATAYFAVAPQEMALSTSHDVVLSENSKSAASTLDLSLYSPNKVIKAQREPANCYIVNRQGSYTFPLYYGNMTANNESMPACFKDHAGNTIKKHNIKDQIGAKSDGDSHGTTEYYWSTINNDDKNVKACLRVALLWQDVNGLITSPTVSTTGNNIGFEISKSTPGNAVLALQARKVTYATDWTNLTSSSDNTYGDWETLWTWHVWMTDEVYQNDEKENEQWYDTYYINGPTTNVQGDHIVQLKNNSGENVAQVLPVNLGWVPDEMDFGKFKQRQCWVKLTQTGSSEVAYIKISQHARQQLITGTGTNYQWGRPTAFPAFHTIDGSSRTLYDVYGNDVTSQFVMAQATSGADAIAQPFQVLQWHSNENSWFDVGSADYDTENAMWNAASKTVYDPCPPGFHVPAISIFSGFSTTGATVVNEAGKLNMYQNTTNLNGEVMKNGELRKGGYFYTKANETERYGDVVYMPATGHWHGNKEVGSQMAGSGKQLDQNNGIYWVADYNDDGSSKACFLWLSPDNTFSAGSVSKPVIGFFDADHKENYYGTVRAIRPAKAP